MQDCWVCLGQALWGVGHCIIQREQQPCRTKANQPVRAASAQHLGLRQVLEDHGLEWPRRKRRVSLFAAVPSSSLWLNSAAWCCAFAKAGAAFDTALSFDCDFLNLFESRHKEKIRKSFFANWNFVPGPDGSMFQTCTVHTFLGTAFVRRIYPKLAHDWACSRC